MTVSSLVPVNNYTGNGSTCQFDFDFLIEDEKELVVTLMNKKENTKEQLIFGVDYSINEIGSKNGSFIIYPLEEISSHEVLSPDEVLTLSLNLDIKQESEFENSATLKLDVLEWTFDYIVRVLQILSRKVDRSVKIVEGENTKPEELVQNLFDAEFNSKLYAKAAYQNLEEIKEMNTKINSDMKKLDKELKEVLHKTGDEDVSGIKNFTDTIFYKGENLLDYISTDFTNEISAKQDKLIAGDNILIEDNIISANGGFALFDTKLSDHILDGEESKGWALQGTYVYKEAVAGVRDGYPDFYNKVVEEYNNAVSTEMVNGITVKVNSNGHKFYNIADKTTIDEVFNNTGLAWLYGVDTENERVFLPRNVWFEQLTSDTSQVGDSVEAGLPNITGHFGGIEGGSPTVSGVFYKYSTGHSGAADGGGDAWIGFDASLSSGVYGNSTTVQPNAIKKLLYICVGNTNVESAITDIVEVTTTENDTMPLFTGMYFDFKPNNISWLKAGEQANSGDVYTTAYNELVNCLNGVNKYNLKVIDIADMVSGVDYSEYWKVNQDEMYFVCPTKLSYGAYSDVAPVAGNGMALGMTSGEIDFVLGEVSASPYPIKPYQNVNLPIEVGTTLSGNGESITNTAFGIITDETKSGIEAHLKQSTSELYFKVANAVQNLELLNVGEVMEAVTDKISRQDCIAYVTETFRDGSSWYRVYSDGWCEQGGRSSATSTLVVVNLLKPFIDTNYSVITTGLYDGGNTANAWDYVRNFTTSTFSIYQQEDGCVWEAKGYIS